MSASKAARAARWIAGISLAMGVGVFSARAGAVDGNAPAAAPPEPRHLDATRDAPELFAFPPAGEGAHPITFMLHGMCDAPENECGHFASATRDSFLVCPRAPSSCGNGGGTQWGGTIAQKQALMTSARAAVEAEFPDRVAKDETTLVGFSQGAFVGLHLGEEGGFPYLVLIAAAIEPNVAKLRAAGVKRIALAAGDFDGSRGTMEKARRTLERGGIETKYFSMGRTGHWLPADTNSKVGAMLDWVHAKPQPAEVSAR